MCSSDLSAIIGNSSDLQSPIFFGSLGFNPHSPITRPTFEDLQAGVEVSFGELRFFVNKWGTLRLTDALHPAATTPATSSTAAEESALSMAAPAFAVYSDDEFLGNSLEEIASFSTATTRSSSPNITFARTTEWAVVPYATSTPSSSPSDIAG